MAESLEEAAQKVASGHGVHEDKYGLVEIRDLKITDLGKLKTRGSISLQTGKPYNCTTLISVPARNIRSAEGEGFISMRGAMRCEVMYQDKTWHAKKHDLSAEWFLDCPVGEEPEIRRRGRIALEADQTPSDERKEVMDPQERNRQYPIVEEGEPVEVSFSYQGKSLVARWNGLTYKNEQRRVDFWEVGKEHLIRSWPSLIPPIPRLSLAGQALFFCLSPTNPTIPTPVPALPRATSPPRCSPVVSCSTRQVAPHAAADV